jgi:hypothetical protein
MQELGLSMIRLAVNEYPEDTIYGRDISKIADPELFP